MLENQCALEIENPESASPEIKNPEIISPEIVNPEIVNLEILNLEIVNVEIMNFGVEGAIRRRGGIDVTSDSIMKDLREGFVWTQGLRYGDIWPHPDVDVG